MNGMHATNRNCLLRRSLILITAWLLLGAVGCSGSGGDGGSGGGGGGPPDPPGPPPGNVTLTVTARDAFGAAVPGASIALLHSSGTGILKLDSVTDASGRLEVVGGFEDVYAAIVSAADMRGNSYEASRPADKRIDFEVTLHPESALTSGVGRLLDGRHGAVDVTIRLESPVAGAFASGHTVVGTLQVVACPSECTESIDVPFALRVP